MYYWFSCIELTLVTFLVYSVCEIVQQLGLSRQREADPPHTPYVVNIYGWTRGEFGGGRTVRLC